MIGLTQELNSIYEQDLKKKRVENMAVILAYQSLATVLSLFFLKVIQVDS
ncbi:MAG: hypothetical protein AAF757_24245 [Cyanobacteria bacterium P01_D01_bin.116]